VLDSGSNEKCFAILSKASTLLTRMVDKNVCYCRCDWIQPQCLVRLIFACFQERTFTMALELITDGATTTSTTGDVATSTTGATTDYKLGTTNTTTIGAVYGFCTFMLGVYTGFVNAVTGVSINMNLGVSISLFYGYRCVVQGGACTTVSAIQETNVQNGLTKLIADLRENITSRNQIIETSTNAISTLYEAGTVRTIDYDTENTTGDTSTEEWSISKNITSGSYSLNCEESASISVDGSAMMVTPSGVMITGTLLELGD